VRFDRTFEPFGPGAHLRPGMRAWPDILAENFIPAG
jgi:hypothetical protein